MTKSQRKSHKQGNQVRKAIIMHRQRTSNSRRYWAMFGLIQDGKFTKGGTLRARPWSPNWRDSWVLPIGRQKQVTHLASKP